MRAFLLAALLGLPGAAASTPGRGAPPATGLVRVLESGLASGAALPLPGLAPQAPLAPLPGLPQALPAEASAPALRDPRLLILLERLRSLPAETAAPAAPAVAAAGGSLAAVASALGTLSADQIRDMGTEDLGALSARVWDAVRPRDGVEGGLLGPGRFDPAEGLRELEALEALNDELAAGKVSAADLEARGVIRYGAPSVTRGRPGEPGGDQAMPFRELLLPAARTGVYAPTRLGPMKDYQGLLVVMPGIGADVSNAKTVLDLALTFSKAKKDPVLDDVEGRRLRLIAFPLDATLNGMAKDAPFAFGSPRGGAAVTRHAVLVLKLLYPGLPAFVAGRSQGGLIALEYAARHGEAAGVVALNPSHPSAAIVADTVRTHELEPQAILGSQSFTLDEKAWTAYKHFTPRFETLERPSSSRVLLLLGLNDPSYPQPDYLASYQGFAARQAADRAARVFDLPSGKSHNLWNRHEEAVYRQVVGDMARFFVSLLP